MRPTLRAVLLFLAGGPVALLCALVKPELWTMWLGLLGGSVVLMAFDVLLSIPRRRVSVDIELPDCLFIGSSHEMPVTIGTKGWKRPISFDLIVDVGDELVPIPMISHTLPPGESEPLHVTLKPTRRGNAEVTCISLRWVGPLGLTSRQIRKDIGTTIAVVPNIAAVRSAAIRFFSRDSQFGTKIDKKRGEGSEFDALREYVEGMDHRAIDWKHSARHRRLVAKEFRSERNHPVVLALDTGHLMSQPIADVPKLDYAINSALMLGYIALRTGDRVSMFAFDEKVRSYTKPQGGIRTFDRIQRQSSDLEYRSSETNFTLGLAELATRLNRRSLVVLFTDFVDTITAELMLENVQRLVRKHLVIFVASQDPTLSDMAMAEPESMTDMHSAVIAANLVRERELVMQKLKRLGVHCLDVHPGQVSASLVNNYLDIKRRELL